MRIVRKTGVACTTFKSDGRDRQKLQYVVQPMILNSNLEQIELEILPSHFSPNMYYTPAFNK